ncbi:MAG: hypothetical protein ACI4T2_02840 [Christensenellales bacterium]
MSINTSELNDLASVDIMFAEMMAESGVNPIPSVCDGCDMSILEQDNKTVSSAFERAETNIQTLISALDMSMDMDNKDSISRVVDNLREKQQIIANAKQNFKNPNYNFVELYTDLKKVQNKLGLNLNCPEMNVLKLTEENFDIDKTKEKVMQAAKELDQFLKEGEKNFEEFLSEDKELDEEKLSEKMKQKIQEVKRRKQMQRENQMRLSNRIHARTQTPTPEPARTTPKTSPTKSNSIER